MYYPYLRGKQFDLLALREFADNYENYKITPIIEPVRNSLNSLKLAIKKFNDKGLRFALILNPQVGELIGMTDIIKSSLADELSDGANWHPAFIITMSNIVEIRTHISENDYQNVHLVIKEGIDPSSPALDPLVHNRRVTHVVISPNNNRSVIRQFKNGSKQIIRLDDCFIPQRKNSDYSTIPEEMLTEEHLYYGEEGYNGISDYTVLPSDFIDSGMLPYAIAIHWSYKKRDNTIWVRHFVSDTNDDNSNIQGKFHEATRKAVAFFDEENINNFSRRELTDYYNNNQYPGLGVTKKVSIKNHIELMQNIFTNEN